MDFRACLDDQIGRLVHPAAHASPIEGARHRSFMATRLGVAFGALAFIPFYLVGGGVPGFIEAVVLAWLVMPLLAVVHVSRSGRLVEGEVVSLATWIGLAATLFFGRVCDLGPAVALLFLVPLEAGFSGSSRVARSATAAALAVATILVALAGTRLFEGAPLGPANTVCCFMAAVYAAIVSWHGFDLRALRTQAEGVEALRFRTLSEAVGDLVLRFDRTGTALAASPSAERLLGLKPRDLIGRGLFDRVHVADRPAFLKLVSDAAVGAECISGSVRVRVGSSPSRDGRYDEPTFAWIEMRARGIATAGESGQEAHVLAVIRDITSRMRHEMEIAQSARDAEEANAWKDRFLATVSHELRTPLNAIIGFGEILASEAHGPQDGVKRREYAGIIHTSGQHLLSVVNSLLDMSKIEAGKFALECEPFDVAVLVAACCDMVGLKAEQSRIDLIREIEPGLPDLVGDKRACRQIVINLLSNALKFTSEYGSVTVSVRREAEVIVLAVTDTGIGMRAPDMARLGDPFFQAQSSYDRRYEGSGLGLSVVSGLVGLHGGTITADSAPGEGTRMTIRLPQNGVHRPVPNAKAKIEVLPRKVRPVAQPAEAPARKVQKIA